MHPAGAQFGTVLGLLFTGILTSSFGWPSVFYCAGGLGVAWCLAWLWLGADSPVAHPRIDPQERDYIKEQVSANASLAKVKQGRAASVLLAVSNGKSVIAAACRYNSGGIA